MSRTVGVGVNDIHKLCVRGVQPLARRRAPVQGARGVKACGTKPWPWHRLTPGCPSLRRGDCWRRAYL